MERSRKRKESFALFNTKKPNLYQIREKFSSLCLEQKPEPMDRGPNVVVINDLSEYEDDDQDQLAQLFKLKIPQAVLLHKEPENKQQLVLYKPNPFLEPKKMDLD